MPDKKPYAGKCCDVDVDEFEEDVFKSILRPEDSECSSTDNQSSCTQEIVLDERVESLISILLRFKGNPTFYRLLARMVLIHESKNQDYGDGNPFGNFYKSKEVGVDVLSGVLVRMSDKWSRICTLAKRKNNAAMVKDESIEDTLIDMANYAIIACSIYKNEIQNKPTSEQEGENAKAT